MAGTLELLGVFRIAIDGETVRRIESDKGRALLAYLAVEADRPHTRSTLVGLLWPDVPETVARHNLSQALFNVRQVLGKHHTVPVLQVDRTTLQWSAHSDVWVDVREVAALLDACTRHVHPDPTMCAPCAERRERIIALHRGPFLAGLEVRDSDVWEDWLNHKRHWYENVVLGQLEVLATFYARRGVFDRARQYVLRSIELDPWREEAQRQLIALSLEAGDRSAAIAHYKRWCARLDTELGIEPAAETQRVYERALHQPEEVVLAPFVSRLPVVGPCIGRTAELGTIDRLLEGGTRLLTITGQGGTGKTRLALEVARRHKSSVCFVPLAPVRTTTEFVRAVADAIGCTLDPTMDLWDQTLQCLAARTTLLVLDNFEQLMEATHTINDMLQHAPGITLVVTSRERLGLQAETVFALGGLATDATDDNSNSVELFITRARRVRANWAPHGDERHCIARICQTLGGLPLAIELAAGWIGVLSCAEIEQELTHDLDLLCSSLRDVPVEHQSMRHVFERSWTLLPVPQQRMLRQLSTFQDGFDRQAATAVAHDEGTSVVAHVVLDRLQALVNASLCRVSTDDGAATRYHFHPLIQRYAAEHLASSDEHEVTRRRHARYFLELAERAHTALERSRSDAPLADLEREHANLRVALAWTADVEPHTLALRFVRALAPFWYAHGYWDEGGGWFERVVHAEPPDTADLADVLLAGGSLAILQGDTGRARTWLERSSNMYQVLDDRHGYARSLNQLGALAEFEGDDDAAAALHMASIAVLRDVGNDASLAPALSDLGDVVRRQGGDASALYEESHSIARASGDPRMLSRTLYDLAVLMRERGELERAMLILQESVAIAQTLGDRLALLGSLTQLGETARQRGDLPQAVALQETSLREARALGSAWSIAWTLLNLGRAVEATGDHERAWTLLDEALRYAQRAGDQHRINEIKDTLGALTTPKELPVVKGVEPTESRRHVRDVEDA